MIKRFIFVYKREDMSGEDFRRYYIEHHGPIVSRMPGLLYYRQNPTLPDANGNEQEISGIAEVWYETEEAFRHALASPEAKLANESLLKFTDVSRQQIIAVEEFTIR